MFLTPLNQVVNQVVNQVINQVINQGAKKPPFLGVDWLIDCKMLQFFRYVFVENNNALRF